MSVELYRPARCLANRAWSLTEFGSCQFVNYVKIAGSIIIKIKKSILAE